MGSSFGKAFFIERYWSGTYEERTIHSNSDTTQWEQVKNNFVVQVTDGNIGVYAADTHGIKGTLIVEKNDNRIVKSELNTLTASASNQENSQGTARIRGVCGK